MTTSQLLREYTCQGRDTPAADCLSQTLAWSTVELVLLFAWLAGKLFSPSTIEAACSPPPSHSKPRHSNPVHLFLLWKPRHTGRLYSSPAGRSKDWNSGKTCYHSAQNLLSFSFLSLNLKLFFFFLLCGLDRFRINSRSMNYLVRRWTHWASSTNIQDSTNQHRRTQTYITPREGFEPAIAVSQCARPCAQT
jgi:hypothetical protein